MAERLRGGAGPGTHPSRLGTDARCWKQRLNGGSLRTRPVPRSSAAARPPGGSSRHSTPIFRAPLRADAPPILVTGESGTGRSWSPDTSITTRPSARARPIPILQLCRYPRRPRRSAALRPCEGLPFTGRDDGRGRAVQGSPQGCAVPGRDRRACLPTARRSSCAILETRSVQPVGDTREVPVDVQLVLATNRNLEEEVAAHRFREDLFYRVSGLMVSLVLARDPSRISRHPRAPRLLPREARAAPQEEDHGH